MGKGKNKRILAKKNPFFVVQKGDSDSKHRDSRFGTRLGLEIGLEIQSCLSLGLGLDSKTRSFWSQTRNRVSKTGTRETLLGSKEVCSLIKCKHKSSAANHQSLFCSILCFFRSILLYHTPLYSIRRSCPNMYNL